jgi:hypothetical protein
VRFHKQGLGQKARVFSTVKTSRGFDFMGRLEFDEEQNGKKVLTF